MVRGFKETIDLLKSTLIFILLNLYLPLLGIRSLDSVEKSSVPL